MVTTGGYSKKVARTPMDKVTGGLDHGNLVKSEVEVGSWKLGRFLLTECWKDMEKCRSKAWES